jgi:ribosome-interacting GTPase 1
MKIRPSFIDSRKLITIDLPGKCPKIPEGCIVRIRPSAETSEVEIEKTVALVQKKAASVRVLAKPKGSAVAQATVSAVQVKSLRDICQELAEAVPERMRFAVVAEVEERLRSSGL